MKNDTDIFAVAQDVATTTDILEAFGRLVDQALQSEPNILGYLPFSQDALYPPSSAGFRFKTSVHTKDAPYNCKADGVTDDSDALVNLFTMTRVVLGGRCEIVFDPGIHCCQKLLQCTSNTTIRFVGSLKCIGNPASGTDTLMLPVNGASNVVLLNPTIDLNFIPAVNGVVCRTGHAGFMSIGGEVKNGRHDKGGTQGGRAFIVESLTTSLNNRAPKIIGLRCVNCYMAGGVQGGSGTATTPVNGGRSLVLIDDISIEDCDIGIVGFGVPAPGSSFPYPYDADIMHIQIGSVVTRNTGHNTQYAGMDCIFGADRGCNMVVDNFSSYNTSDYSIIDAVVRGNFAKSRVKGTFFGSANSAICFSPYKESDSGPAFENSVQDTDIDITVHGTVADFIKNTATSAAYVTRSTVSGSATVVSSGRVVPSNFTTMTSLTVNLYERTQNSRVAGKADQVSGTLFSALPGKDINLDLARIGPIDIRGDATITSFAPSQFYRDQSGSAIDGKISVDANVFNLMMESATGTDVFNPFLTYNAGTASARGFSGTTAVFGWNLGYVYMPALGNYVNDAAAAAASVPVGGVYRNAGILQVRIV